MSNRVEIRSAFSDALISLGKPTGDVRKRQSSREGSNIGRKKLKSMTSIIPERRHNLQY
jgi:hypothetical protein